MFRRVAFHNTATSLAYTADPRYHEADALYQVKTKKRRLRAYALSHERHKRGIAAVPLLSGVLFKLICNKVWELREVGPWERREPRVCM